MFIDYVKISVKAGNGGSGCVSFRREKFVPKGGPDGGDGGKGGDVIFVANHHLHTLLDFRYRHHFSAKNGRYGQGANKTGRCGESVLIKVPIGTTIRDRDTGEIVGDLTDDGQQVVGAHGGRGGRGNARFKTSTDQAPRYSEPGEEGEERELELELKLIADVGLVGLPNAGKSTLLARVSAAKPKIADYPFTTLTPHLGIVKYGDFSFVMADIPGLIEGAHTGKGLGLQFLRHIERTRVLVFMIDSSEENIEDTYRVLYEELHSYQDTLVEKLHIIALSKCDLIDDIESVKSKLKLKGKTPICAISSVSGDGIDNLLQTLVKILKRD